MNQSYLGSPLPLSRAARTMIRRYPHHRNINEPLGWNLFRAIIGFRLKTEILFPLFLPVRGTNLKLDNSFKLTVHLTTSSRPTIPTTRETPDHHLAHTLRRSIEILDTLCEVLRFRNLAFFCWLHHEQLRIFFFPSPLHNTTYPTTTDLQYRYFVSADAYCDPRVLQTWRISPRQKRL